MASWNHTFDHVINELGSCYILCTYLTACCIDWPIRFKHVVINTYRSVITPRAHAQQGVKQSVCPSVVVVVVIVNTKMARSA